MVVSQNRIKRYLEKLNHIKLRSKQIQTWINDTPIKSFVKQPMPLLAVYKAYQEILEALFDIVAMMCKDRGVPPRDDITNLRNLDTVFEDTHITHLEALNTLRNKVTHRYNHSEDEDYIRLILEGISKIPEITKVIQQWVRQR